MKGTAYKLITQIIESRSKGNELIKKTTQTKLLLKGIKYDKYDENTPDNPAEIDAIRKVAIDLGINLNEGEY